MTGIHTVLFDLDGTIADTAPDLTFALNAVLKEWGREPLPISMTRSQVSHGATAMIRQGFRIDTTTAEFPAILQRLLELYRHNIARETRLFDGVEQLLTQLEQRGIRWGIVTNKPGWLTKPLLQQLDLYRRAATVISGDTLTERKPHPAPLLRACEESGSSAANSLYVGDAERDIEAGRRAGLRTLVALFGYLDEQDSPKNWQADGMIHNALEILDWLERW